MGKNGAKAFIAACCMLAVFGMVGCTMHKDKMRASVRIACIENGGHMNWLNQCELP